MSTERFNDGAMKVLDLALREAFSLGHNYIGPEHLLLGLARTKGVAGEVLTQRGLSIEGARSAVVAVLSRAQCVHPDVRHLPDEKGAIACMKCGRLFGHLCDGTMEAFNP